MSSGWWDSFRKDHPFLTFRHAESLSYARSVPTDSTEKRTLICRSKHLKNINDLFERPAQIFKCDETGFPIPSHIVGVIGQKHSRAFTTGNKKSINVFTCCNAAEKCHKLVGIGTDGASANIGGSGWKAIYLVSSGCALLGASSK